MMRVLLPLLLLALGLGGGIGAGLFLAPAETEVAAITDPCGAVALASAAPVLPATEEAAARDYIRLENQFVVPVLSEGSVDYLVILSLSLEVQAGTEDQVRMMEPRLRDAFLQVMFDHANTGGFDGLYTASSPMRQLRDALLDAAEAAVGPLVTDVLILELVRQEQ